MPRYDYICTECYEATALFRKIAGRDDRANCELCGAECIRGVAAPALGGQMFAGEGNHDGFYSKQLGKRFHSEKQMIEYAESQGLQPVSPTDSSWVKLKEDNREGNDAQAREAGFSDAEARSKDIKEKRRDYIAANRQRKIDKYHSQHGNDSKQTVDTAFGGLDN